MSCLTKIAVWVGKDKAKSGKDTYQQLRSGRKKRASSLLVNQKEEQSAARPTGQEGNCQAIIEQISRLKKNCKSILFAAARLHALPVNLPVNVAIELARINKRCLLIDLDLKRDALAKAFGLDHQDERNGFQPMVLKTEFENLWIWPAHNFTRLKQMNIGYLVQRAMDKYDFILINAPSLLSSPDRRYIASSAQAAIVFSSNGSPANGLAELIKNSGCTLIDNISTAPA